MLNGITNFLQFINDNWTSILIIISIIVAIYEKIKKYMSKSQDEKVEIAKTQIKETILKMISDAEIDYETWNEAGSIKRSQVIQKIFADYPILSKVMNQDNLIAWIDETIDEALKTLREIVKNNSSDSE